MPSFLIAKYLFFDMTEFQDNNRRMIQEAIRKIALGRSLERVDMSPEGTSGVGTARLIHGYVSKVHDDPSDEEYADYGGTVDVGEYPDETASTEPIVHKGVLLAAVQDNAGGFLIVPTLFSDVTIVMDAATRHTYVVNCSHAETMRLETHTETVIGVTETETLDSGSDSSPDYNELEPTGNEAHSRYVAEGIAHTVKNDSDKESSVVQAAESIIQTVDQSEVAQTTDKVSQKVGSTTVVVADGKVTLGDEQATEPLVLGNELASLMLDFMTECSKIMIPTMLGTMQPLNFPNFISLSQKIQKFLSKTSFTK